MGPLALPPADLVLRPLDLPPQGQPVALQPLGGHRQRSELALQDPGVQRVEGPEGLITPPRPPETNVFWSEKVRREVEGGVQTGQNGAGLKQLNPLKQLNVLEGYHINMELVLVKEHELLWCCRMG